MEIIILLACGLLLNIFSKPSNNQNYRIFVLSGFGITYFFIWHFANYYLNIFEFDETYKNTVFIILASMTTGLMLVPAARNVPRSIAWVMAAIFIVAASSSFLADRSIKHLISNIGGYFSQEVSTTYQIKDSPSKIDIFIHESGGFSIEVPSNWKKLKHTSGQWYFINGSKNNHLNELRPRCFHDAELTISEIVTNYKLTARLEGLNTSHTCGFRNNRFECLVIAMNDEKEVWRWFLMNETNYQNIELDFIFNNDNADARLDAKSIMQSLKQKSLTRPLPYCLSTSEWF